MQKWSTDTDNTLTMVLGQYLTTNEDGEPINHIIRETYQYQRQHLSIPSTLKQQQYSQRIQLSQRM